MNFFFKYNSNLVLSPREHASQTAASDYVHLNLRRGNSATRFVDTNQFLGFACTGAGPSTKRHVGILKLLSKGLFTQYFGH